MTKEDFRELLNKCLLDSPASKTVFAFVLPILCGVLSGTLVMEITRSNVIDWTLLKTAKSAYGLLLLILVIYKYNRAIYRREKEIARFLDNDYCVAYMRSQCLPQAAERFKRLIRDGQGGELKQAMDELKKVLE